ncbi:unnamed protein product [Brassica oleracea]|uniref:(rape) hypothetical protein n=1 Tax=Brassica napus TaxID=3708 RepID=A0A816IDZ9_BRANA|nr:unnamed protein product [Brassica napus]
MHISQYGNSIPRSLSFIFLFLFQFETVFPAPTGHVCHPEQRDALLEFKNEFEIGKPSYICGDSFVPKTKSWANNIDCCYWDGIKCDPKSGKVIVVDLFCSGLHGRFHSDSKLFRIQSLRFLDLSYNDFSGQILTSVGNFSQLATLCLSYNNFVGEIPSSLGNLSNLKFLQLSHNNFIGEIPSSLGNLSNLISIDFYHNNFVGEIPSSLGNLSNLNTLYLSDNNFVGEIPSSFENLSYLDILDLSHNHLVGKLPSLTRLSILRFLNVESNIISDKFPSWLTSLTNLRFLILSFNSFHGPIQKIKSLKKLEIIDISHNHFNGTLPEVFANGCNLRTLHVGHNELAGKLPRSLSKCSYLEVLNMEHNGISDTFPFWLESLQSLQVLVLHSNEFHGSLQHHHPKSASSFPELHIIDISYNYFSGILPFDFFVYLRAMYSERNRSELKYIGEERVYYQDDSLVLLNKGVEITYTRILTLLTAVDISGNRLHGEIPKSIDLLKSLIVLNLSSNCFTGDIPSSLANLTMLESLDLSHNKLSSQIPPALGYLTSLSTVRVSHNQLVGPIPQGVQFQTQDSSSFEDNLGLCGRPLDKKCGDVDTEQLQEPESVEEKEEEEKVFSWTAAAIALAPGVILGLTIGHFVTLQNPQRLMKISVRHQYKATKLYCFVHKVPVCGECICFPEHQTCVVRTYSEWVIDGEYDQPKCCQCQAAFDEGGAHQLTRLGCLHAIHTSCLVSLIKSLPPHTAPPGYACPTCSTPIWPPKMVKDAGSRLHAQLREAIMQHVAAARKGIPAVDRQNSETLYYADDEDGNKKKYSRRGGPLRHKFLRALLPFWSSALPTLPVTAPPRKDPTKAEDGSEGRVRHRSSRMDIRKILLFLAIIACMGTMGILYYRLAQRVIGQEITDEEQQ